MPDYDFTSCLSPIDFELLTKDLLEAELGIRFENFREGKDKGIDLRHAPHDSQSKTIVQCKRYAPGGFSNLKSKLKNEELSKIKKLQPDRYILSTSVSLSPDQADELKELLAPFVQSTDDIYGRDRLNSLLANHPEVERRHNKLWIGSTGVLETILNAGIHAVSREELERTIAAAKIYVRNESFDEALKILESERVCIVSGIPGIGKTTLARMLLLHFHDRDYELIKIESDISEARDVTFHKKPRFYYYDDLRRLLTEDHRYVFTLIHKFRTDPGTLHPVLSERDDIIVLTDEAHRSQYDTLAMNMRTALPKAKFVAFTGTPLIAGEERTREVFGDYVSIYNFRQSIEDGATVPLYYENRTPELEVTNPDLNEEIYQVIDEAGLDEEGEQKLERLLGRRYHLITRDDRLDAVAVDLVHHFLDRGYQGKAMVVSIDKATALKMYDKVRAEWEAETERVLKTLETLNPQRREYAPLHARLQNLQDTDMAVVVSPGQNEIAEMQSKGTDILPHRQRMVKEDLDTKFKDPDDPFRLVFVCAMWLTGFDAPSVSTIYLDKPMRGHTLMQTIARANRVFGDKVNGLIVDYANVFQELEKALALYASGKGGDELPVKDKSELVEALRIALEQNTHFCREHEVDLAAVQAEPARHFLLAINRLARTDEIKDEFLGQSNDVQRLYKAVMPDPIIPELAPRCQVIRELATAVRALSDPVDVSAVLKQIEATLDGSIAADAGLAPGEQAATIDLSQVDFDALEKKFARSKTKNTEAQQLRALIERKLNNLIRLNASRYDYLDRFQKMVEDYNKGALTIEQLFDELVALSQDLTEEENRHMRENLSEEELAIFDIITRPGPDLTQAETDAIKAVCRDMLAKLKTEKLVLDWRKRRTTRADVRVSIEKMLDDGLPEKYTSELFEQKCGALFQHMLEKYPQRNASVYEGGAA